MRPILCLITTILLVAAGINGLPNKSAKPDIGPKELPRDFFGDRTELFYHLESSLVVEIQDEYRKLHDEVRILVITNMVKRRCCVSADAKPYPAIKSVGKLPRC